MSAPRTTSPRISPAQLGVALVVDVVCVIVFSMVGRGAHGRESGLAGLASTAWPFLVGLAIAWILWLVARRGNPVTAGAGVWFWLFTLVGGMAIWVLREGRVPHWSFLIVAGIATAILLIGWRAIAAVIERRRAARA